MFSHSFFDQPVSTIHYVLINFIRDFKIKDILTPEFIKSVKNRVELIDVFTYRDYLACGVLDDLDDVPLSMKEMKYVLHTINHQIIKMEFQTDIAVGIDDVVRLKNDLQFIMEMVEADGNIKKETITNSRHS